MDIKQFFRRTLNYLHLDVTKNLAYDRLTLLIMKKVLHADANCIDVGCHKGEILDAIIELAPNGKHFAFEPIPSMFGELTLKFEGKATIYPFALSDNAGTATFNHVKNAPAYSGLEKRDYAVSEPEIERITVEVRRLDDLIPRTQRIDFLKIDVEGGEFGVLKGARELLTTHQPVLLFECGLGASNHYGTQPKELFQYLEKIGYAIFLLKDFVHNKSGLNQAEFEAVYMENKEYYFVAQSLNQEHLLC